MHLKLYFNAAEHAAKVHNFSRKVLHFLPIPPYFFGKLLHFRFAPTSLPLAVLHRERDNAAVHYIWVFRRHEIPKKEKKAPHACQKGHSIYPKMGIAVLYKSL